MTWYTPDNMNEVCEHGSQRRKCVVCESIWQDRRIEELEREYISTDDVSAEIEVDQQHGRIVRARFGKTTIAIYLDLETAVVTKPDGQYGLEVRGNWQALKDAGIEVE